MIVYRYTFFYFQLSSSPCKYLGSLFYLSCYFLCRWICLKTKEWSWPTSSPRGQDNKPIKKLSCSSFCPLESLKVDNPCLLLLYWLHLISKALYWWPSLNKKGKADICCSIFVVYCKLFILCEMLTYNIYHGASKINKLESELTLF